MRRKDNLNLLGFFFTSFLTGLLMLGLYSCSSTESSAKTETFRIDYYSTGGFTNVTQGITIYSSGFAENWEERYPSGKNIINTFELDAKILEKIDSILQNQEWFKYKNNFTGNLTSYLQIKKNNNTNKISFNSIDLPADMPQVLKELFKMIKSI